MSEIEHIGVLSAAKLIAIIYAVIGLIVGLLFSLTAVTGFALAGEDGGAAALLFGVGAVIVMPIAYGVMGFILGAIATWVYNVAAGMVGGVELRLSIKE